MFQIYKGGTTFKQWSKGNKLVMDVLPVGADVLFYNETYSDSPIKSDVYEITNEDDEIIKVCDVPSALLTEVGKIKVCVGSVVTGKYGVNHSMVGPREKYFEVEPADKPSNYVEDPVPTGSGVSSWNQLTDKPFYKEVTVTKKPVDLSLREYWQDDIAEEDIVRFSPGMQMYTYCKISDGTLSNDDVRKLSITMPWNGELKTINYSDLPDNEFIIEDDYVVVNSGMCPVTIIVRKPGVGVRVSNRNDYDLVLFNKVGFYIDGELSGPASIKTVEPVFTFTTETIKRMDPAYLPEGVPYKERAEISDYLSLEWDSDWASKLDDTQIINGVFGKVSDAIMTEYAIKAIYLDYKYDGSTNGFPLSRAWDAAVEFGDVNDNGCILCDPNDSRPMVAFCWSDEGMAFGTGRDQIVFPEPGIYLFMSPDYYVSYMGTDGPITYIDTIIHPLTPEFLPAGVGGGCVMVEFDAMNSTHSANLSELYAAAKAGKIVMCRGGIEMGEAIQYVYGYFSGYVKQGDTEAAAFIAGMNGCNVVMLMPDGTVQTDIFGG